MKAKQTGLSLAQRAETEAFKLLGKNLQGILILALIQRDLAAALRTVYPEWDRPTVHKVVIDLLRNENVRKVVERYAIGESEPVVDVIPASEPAGEVAEEIPATVAGDLPRETVCNALESPKS